MAQLPPPPTTEHPGADAAWNAPQADATLPAAPPESEWPAYKDSEERRRHQSTELHGETPQARQWRLFLNAQLFAKEDAQAPANETREDRRARLNREAQARFRLRHGNGKAHGEAQTPEQRVVMDNIAAAKHHMEELRRQYATIGLELQRGKAYIAEQEAALQALRQPR